MIALALWLCTAPQAPASAPAPPPALHGLALERAFPAHEKLKRPIWFGALPDGSGRQLVAEQHGLVRAFAFADAAAPGPLVPWLDLSARVSRAGNEEGLLGLALHPRLPETRRLFAHYSVRGAQKGRLSEFRLDASGAPDPASERVLAEIEQPYRNHNGGEIAFGPDGQLYWGLGDGGAAGDPHQNAQNLSSWLGKLLRIDVDAPAAGAAGWRASAGNPFVDVPGARPEIWALGLRNPWRFSFDAEGGALWVGDVGQNVLEEIDVVVRGGNYGWRAREGDRPFDENARLGPGPLREPVLVYPRSEGWSVTGGFVYRGKALPELAGQYVYADFVSGRVWAVPAAAAEDKQLAQPRWIASCESPASFGLDARGELYVCSFDGHVYRFARAAAEVAR